MTQISDAVSNSLGFSGISNYSYDPAGRLKTDSQKGEITYNHLSLPTLLKKGTDELKYTYDATGRRVKRQFKTEKARYYVGGVEYEDGKLRFISTEYGRIRRDNSNWVYDYFLKDHLGNIRVVLPADPITMQAATSNRVVYMATMEEGKSSEENLYFANLDAMRADRPYNYPDNNPLNQKLAKVPGKSRGPSIMLRVMAGDTIEISAKAFYNMDNTLPGKGVDIAPVVGSAIAAMTNPTGAVLDEAAQLALDLGAEASQSVALVPIPQKDDQNDNPQPKSGLNFVLYSAENLEVVEANTGVQIVEDRINAIQNLYTDKMVMQKAGFLEVFVNNEAQTPVYYDNLMVAQSTGPVMEVNAYYPYGMIIGGLSFQAGDPSSNEYNAYKYNGKELQDLKDFKTGWLDYGARMMEPAIGRWWCPDPLAEEYYSLSPYAYAGNNPILFIDPNGQTFTIYLQGGDDDENMSMLGNFLAILYQGLENQYTVNTVATKDGGWRISLSANEDAKLSERGQAFYNNLSEIVDDSFDTKIGLVYGSDQVDVGNYNTGQVDIADLIQFPVQKRGVENTVGTMVGKATHEFVEQYQKQKNGLDFKSAHKTALKAEADVDGLQRINLSDEQKYIPANIYGVPRKGNELGQRTLYYNPNTGTYFYESALYNESLYKKRGIIKLLSPYPAKTK